ncbi:hypothetical protein SEA_JUJU_48 [Gordonia phage JuJu]|uniref:Uncharacterized protein n=1 Tax=Gordonia phage JuJu TaxID=2590929 RepID=A0A516KR41_9CAUD|nr:hypothetical protein KNU69_gp48 [Gordonia phage JuJu]QDP44164.1 hypothetical protein SEA_JUJU_48 [Gordonia phage JuJu]
MFSASWGVHVVFRPEHRWAMKLFEQPAYRPRRDIENPCICMIARSVSADFSLIQLPFGQRV